MAWIIVIAIVALLGVGYLWWKYGRTDRAPKIKQTQPEEEVLEITSDDIDNLRRLPEILKEVQSFKNSLAGNGHKESEQLYPPWLEESQALINASVNTKQPERTKAKQKREV